MCVHSCFSIGLEVVSEKALPIFDAHRVHEPGDPVEMLQHGMKPVITSLE